MLFNALNKKKKKKSLKAEKKSGTQIVKLTLCDT